MSQDLTLYNEDSLNKAIQLCQKKTEEFKGNEVKKKKYEVALSKLQAAKTKREKAIAETKGIMMSRTVGGATETKSFYDWFIAGNESAVTLTWLGAKTAVEGVTLTTNLSADSIETKYDFVDFTKKQMKDVSKGKGISKFLTGTAIGAIIGEVLSHGVTQILVKQGIMKHSMGLFGVAKLGIENLPAAFSALGSGITTLWGVAPVGLVAAGALVTLTAIPVVANLVKKAKAKHKANNQFENDMQKLVAAQPTLAV